MITLVLTVCALASPGASVGADPQCREVAVALDAETPMACFAVAPMVVAQWGDLHPKWRIEGWRCETAGPAWRI